MFKKYNQQGFSVVAVVLLVAIIALVGVIGWRVYVAQQDISKSNSTDTAQQQTSQTSDPASGGEIKNNSDMQKVQDSLDSASIDADLDSSSLYQDLNAIL